MSVKIRLQRGGRISLPIYTIVATDSRRARDKQFIERLGFYNPKARGQETPFTLNEDRLNYWVSVGAQVTDVVARLLVKHAMGPQKVRDAFTQAKARRIKVAQLLADKQAKGEQLKAAAEASKAAEEAAAQAKADAEAAQADAAKAAETATPADETPAQA